MFSSIQSIPGLIFARSDVKAKIRPGVEAKRIWSEINQRINYPLKWILVDMESSGEISMGDDTTKFCVSWVTICVMESAIKDFINAWNCHRIPGRNGGIPNKLALESRVSGVPPCIVPSTPQCLQVHEGNGCRLSRNPSFGSDPLNNYPQLQRLRKIQFRTEFPDWNLVFQDVLHRDGQLFRNSIHRFIFLTHNYSNLIV